MGTGVLQHTYIASYSSRQKSYRSIRSENVEKRTKMQRKKKEKKKSITIVNYKYDACFVLHHILLILIFRENVSALCKVFFAYSFSCCIILIARLTIYEHFVTATADVDVIIMVALVLQNNDSI